MLIGMLAAERIERTEAARFATGTGTNQPTGALVAFTQHVTPDLQYDISDATLVNAWQSFIRVKYAVNAGWRQSPSFSFIPGDTLDMLFAAAVDDDARPIFPQWGFGSTAKGMGMNLGGMNIRADYNIAAIVLTTALANSNAGLVGDFSAVLDPPRGRDAHDPRPVHAGQRFRGELGLRSSVRCRRRAERNQLDQPERTCRQTRRYCVGARPNYDGKEGKEGGGETLTVAFRLGTRPSY